MGFNETTQQFDIFMIPDTVRAANIQYNKQNINEKDLSYYSLTTCEEIARYISFTSETHN